MHRNSLMNALENPDRAWIVFLIGMILVYRECSAPGRVLPGVLGAVGVCISVYSLFQHPWHAEALIAILVGAGLLIVQVFRWYSWIPGAAAAILITLGVNRLTDPSISPLLSGLSIPLSGITIFLLRTGLMARRNKVSLQ